MDRRLKDLMYTFGANFLNFLMGFVTGFIIPKFLGIDDYAYLKVFTFYVTYVGVSHLGFLDGIYIKYGAYDYEDLPREKFRGYFRILILFQIIEAIILSILTFAFIGNEHRIIIVLFTIFNMIILNLTSLWAFIHQFTKRFKLFSVNTILTKLLYVIGSLCLIFCGLLGYLHYVILQTIINLIILLIYTYYNKELVFGKAISIKETVLDAKNLIGMGFFIMIGNFMSTIILGIDRIFVDRFFTIKDFAIYSFAYTLISLFYILLNSVQMVIYPYLTRVKQNTYKQVYEVIRISITVLMSITLCGYFFIIFIVSRFLPQYIESFDILIFLVPTVMYSGQMNILISNYYKVLHKTKEYTTNNIVAFILSIVTNLIAFMIWRNITAIAIATLISFILWLIYSDLYFVKTIKVNVVRAYVLDFLVVTLFLFSAYFFEWYIGLIIYVILLAILLMLNNKKDINNLVSLIKKR